MDQSRFLIIGAFGQLGTALQAKYPQAVAVDRDTFDLTDWKKLSNYDWSKVDVILNAAAYTDVDGAETAEGRRLAWQVNAEAAGYLARIATQNEITLVHISTDYVFDGSLSEHIETEPLTPLGVYGQTKAAGDIAVSASPKHYILRTSWVVGEGRNFVRTMADLATKGIAPKVVGDQVGRLTFTADLAESIDFILAKQAPYGTYNVSNDGEIVSWAEIARAVFQVVGGDHESVTAVTTTEYFADKPEAARRPLNSALDLTKITKLGFKPRDWRIALVQYLKEVK